MKDVRCRLAAALLVALALAAAPAPAQGAVYGFTLMANNTAANPDTGETIRVTGSGTFDTATGTVQGGGSYTVFGPDGRVTERGTWSANALVSFDSYGGVNPGFQAGLLMMTITAAPDGGAPVTGVPMTVLCVPEIPGKEVPEEGEEGVTVGPFSERVSGFTLFHLVSP